MRRGWSIGVDFLHVCAVQQYAATSTMCMLHERSSVVHGKWRMIPLVIRPPCADHILLRTYDIIDSLIEDSMFTASAQTAVDG